MLDFLLLFDICCKLSGAHLFFFYCVGAVVAGKRTNFCIFNFDDLTCDLIEEVSVVGDDKYCTLVV